LIFFLSVFDLEIIIFAQTSYDAMVLNIEWNMRMQLNNVDELSMLSLKCMEGYILIKLYKEEYELETRFEVDIQKYEKIAHQ
jgi:hypothetical protein